MPFSRGSSECVRVMEVVPAIAVKSLAARKILSLAIPAPEPGEVFARPLRFFAPILFPSNFRRYAQDAGVGPACAERFGHHKGADVDAHAVVDVWLPSDWLFMKRLPSHENVVRRLSGENFFELLLEVLGCGKARIGAIH